MITPDRRLHPFIEIDPTNDSIVELNFDGQQTRIFQIVSHLGAVGKALLDVDCKAELEFSGEEYFASFKTELGLITYVFFKEGRGFKIGPGVTQELFSWHC